MLQKRHCIENKREKSTKLKLQPGRLPKTAAAALGRAEGHTLWAANPLGPQGGEEVWSGVLIWAPVRQRCPSLPVAPCAPSFWAMQQAPAFFKTKLRHWAVQLWALSLPSSSAAFAIGCWRGGAAWNLSSKKWKGKGEPAFGYSGVLM